MQSSYWGYWLVVMGVAIVGLMISVNGLTTTSTQDYYGVKEIVEASMLESVDYGYYRDYNEVKMNKEKFMEVFVRMIAESMSSTDTYEVNFYEIYEAPPKVSVEVKSNSGTSFISNGEYDVTTRVDAVIQIHAEQVGDSGSSIPNQPTNPSSPGEDNPSTPIPTSVKITNGDNAKNLKINDTYQLTFDAPDANTCLWGSDNSGIAIVDHTGFVKFVGNGTVRISVVCGSGTDIVMITVGENADACKAGISEVWNDSIEGVSLTNASSGTRGKIYETLDDIKNGTGNNIRNAVPGVKFNILGETGNYWAIEYEGKCGWVDNRYMGISLLEYLPSSSNPIDYNITNASSSIFKAQGNNLNGITGRQLYSAGYGGFVPLNYQYAKTLKNSILPKAKSMGYRLVVVDAFRPDNVSKAVYNAAKAYAASGSSGSSCTSGLNCYNGKVMGLSWFIAQTSTHGTGCALDVTLKQNGNTIWNAYQDGVANIHELSTSVLKYSNTGCYRKHSCTRNYVAKYNESKYAQDLNAIMMSDSVITDLPSEWWHYNHETCINTMGKDNTVNFWSNI